MNTEKLIFRQDWLGSQPYFYNNVTNVHGRSIHEVIDYSNLEIDGNGLFDFLTFGYSTFGETLIRNVKYVEACQELHQTENGRLRIINYPDPIFMWSSGPTQEFEVIEKFESLVIDWATHNDSQIILPLSGGLDSRFLLWALRNKTNVSTYTYGVSPIQSRSTEVVRASELSGKSNFDWNFVNLQGFHDYLPFWDDSYGASTHAHGMYQMKFYESIKKTVDESNSKVLSGIVGDAWAGSISTFKIRSPKDVKLLGYSHGMNADTSSILFSNQGYSEQFFEKNKEHLNDPLFQTVTIIRTKMMLLSYLISTPELMGFSAWSPFLDEGLVKLMLTITPERRNNRLWQKEFLANQVGTRVLSKRNGDPRNTLDFDELIYNPLQPLNEEVLAEYFDREYLQNINKQISSTYKQKLIRGINLMTNKSVSNRLKSSKNIQKAYNEYLCLFPIQSALLRRK